MKIRLLIISLILLGAYSCGSHQKKLEEKYGLKEKKEKPKTKHVPTLAEIFSQTILSEDLSKYVYKLADTLLDGRETGTRGANKAAEYIKEWMQEQKMLYPDILEGFYQQYTVTQNKKPDVILQTEDNVYHFGKDFISFFPHDSIDLNDDEIIFVGYGIDDKKYNDYAFRDVKGKIVLVIGGEPRDSYGNYIISNEVHPMTGRPMPSVWSTDPLRTYFLRRNAAMRHGAKVMLYYDPYFKNYYWKNYKKYFEDSNIEVSVRRDSIYDFLINKDIFSDITGYDRPEDMHYTKKTRKLDVPIDITYRNNSDIRNAKNVIGILEGDPKSDEFVVVITHYDGQGRSRGVVYPSANDNASGVAASFEIAEAFNVAKDSGFVPRRHIVFINFAGKEQDMIGSRFYISHPVVPIDKTVAVIELHKLGRIRAKKASEIVDFFPIDVSFDGFDKEGFLKQMNHLQSYNYHITLKPKTLTEHSDFFYFMKRHIPIIYFSGGYFDEFHSPDDTAENVSYEVLEQRTRFIFQVIWKLAFQKKI